MNVDFADIFLGELCGSFARFAVKSFLPQRSQRKSAKDAKGGFIAEVWFMFDPRFIGVKH